MAGPPGLRGAERAGVDMMLIDATIAGCVSSWLGLDSSLGAKHLEIADRCVLDLDQVLPLLTDAEEIEYFRRLRRMAVLARRRRPKPGPPDHPLIDPSTPRACSSWSRGLRSRLVSPRAAP
ncbi:hypothetical protein [Streptomyces sp. NPDC091383]|uniref:hypothetical protein n=1 Tax=Streptomyces sp. NPDC091383 TaxID=3365996 RepID=UPI003822588E